MFVCVVGSLAHVASRLSVFLEHVSGKILITKAPHRGPITDHFVELCLRKVGN